MTETIFRITNTARPRQAAIGGNLLYISYVLEMGCRWLQGSDISGFVFSLFLIGFFVFKVNEGKKWARTVILIIAVLNTIAMPFAIWQLVNDKSYNNSVWILIMMAGLGYTIEIAALTLLFTRPANTWFNRNIPERV